jgi:hypothetical protein
MTVKIYTGEIYPAFMESSLGTELELPDELIERWRKVKREFAAVTDELQQAIFKANDFKMP